MKNILGWDERVKRLAEHHGGLTALAAKIGVAWNTVWTWSKGRAVPRAIAQRALERLERRLERPA